MHGKRQFYCYLLVLVNFALATLVEDKSVENFVCNAKTCMERINEFCVKGFSNNASQAKKFDYIQKHYHHMIERAHKFKLTEKIETEIAEQKKTVISQELQTFDARSAVYNLIGIVRGDKLTEYEETELFNKVYESVCVNDNTAKSLEENKSNAPCKLLADDGKPGSLKDYKEIVCIAWNRKTHDFMTSKSVESGENIENRVTRKGMYKPRGNARSSFETAKSNPDTNQTTECNISTTNMHNNALKIKECLHKYYEVQNEYRKNRMILDKLVNDRLELTKIVDLETDIEVEQLVADLLNAVNTEWSKQFTEASTAFSKLGKFDNMESKRPLVGCELLLLIEKIHMQKVFDDKTNNYLAKLSENLLRTEEQDGKSHSPQEFTRRVKPEHFYYDTFQAHIKTCYRFMLVKSAMHGQHRLLMIDMKQVLVAFKHAIYNKRKLFFEIESRIKDKVEMEAKNLIKTLPEEIAKVLGSVFVAIIKVDEMFAEQNTTMLDIETKLKDALIHLSSLIKDDIYKRTENEVHLQDEPQKSTMHQVCDVDHANKSERVGINQVYDGINATLRDEINILALRFGFHHNSANDYSGEINSTIDSCHDKTAHLATGTNDDERKAEDCHAETITHQIFRNKFDFLISMANVYDEDIQRKFFVGLLLAEDQQIDEYHLKSEQTKFIGIAERNITRLEIVSRRLGFLTIASSDSGKKSCVFANNIVSDNDENMKEQGNGNTDAMGVMSTDTAAMQRFISHFNAKERMSLERLDTKSKPILTEKIQEVVDIISKYRQDIFSIEHTSLFDDQLMSITTLLEFILGHDNLAYSNPLKTRDTPNKISTEVSNADELVILAWNTCLKKFVEETLTKGDISAQQIDTRSAKIVRQNIELLQSEIHCQKVISNALRQEASNLLKHKIESVTIVPKKQKISDKNLTREENAEQWV